MRMSGPSSSEVSPLDASSVEHLAWSAPLPQDIFRVEHQGQELDTVALGVAIALGALAALSELDVRVRPL